MRQRTQMVWNLASLFLIAALAGAQDHAQRERTPLSERELLGDVSLYACPFYAKENNKLVGKIQIRLNTRRSNPLTNPEEHPLLGLIEDVEFLTQSDGRKLTRATYNLFEGKLTIVAYYEDTALALVDSAIVNDQWRTTYVHDVKNNRWLGRAVTRDLTTGRLLAETINIHFIPTGYFGGEEVIYDELGNVAFHSKFVRNAATGMLAHEEILNGERPPNYRHYEFVLLAETDFWSCQVTFTAEDYDANRK